MNDDPDILITITSAPTEFEGNLLVTALMSEGIAARLFSGSAAGLQWEGGYTDPIKVMVRRRDAARALKYIQEIRAESQTIDWARVDVNERPAGVSPGLMCWSCGFPLGELPPEAHLCPKCGVQIFANESEGDLPQAPIEPDDSFRRRWQTIRRLGWVLVGISFFGPLVLAAILAFLILIGGLVSGG